MADKPHMNLVFIGHVDHGKSTLVGRVLYNTGAVDENTMRKLKEEAERLGKATFEFAFVMDNLKEASHQFIKALQLDPDYVEASHNLAITCDQLNLVDEALFYYQKIQQLYIFVL